MKTDKEIDDLLKRYYSDRKVTVDEPETPSGMEENLSRLIDNLSKRERKLRIRPLVMWMSSVAAAVAIVVVIALQAEWTSQPESPTIAQGTIPDTFTDPEEAFLATQEIFVFLAENINEGISELEHTRREIKKSNELLIKSITIK
jgi:hypothetical protein